MTPVPITDVALLVPELILVGMALALLLVASLVFYVAFTGQSPVGLEWAPDGVTTVERDRMQEVAEAVMSDSIGGGGDTGTPSGGGGDSGSTGGGGGRYRLVYHRRRRALRSPGGTGSRSVEGRMGASRWVRETRRGP